MPPTDDPFKQLVFACREDFAAWLLGKPVQSVRELTKELPKKTAPLHTDLIFEVTLKPKKTTILHIEFQGRKSHLPMPIRELSYLALIAQEYPNVPIASVVFYVGQGAGVGDDGVHQVRHPNGTVTVEWHYTVIHLWKMAAEDIVAIGRTALLPLIGQTQIAQPAMLLPQVVKRLTQVSDATIQQALLKALVNLTTDREVLQMLEQLLEIDEMYNTAFVQQAQEQGFKQGIEKGLEQGMEKGMKKGMEQGMERGMEQGMEKGLEQGQRTMLCAKTLDILRLRFQVSDSELGKIHGVLNTIDDQAELDNLFTLALRVESFASFWAQLVAPPEPTSPSLQKEP